MKEALAAPEPLVLALPDEEADGMPTDGPDEIVTHRWLNFRTRKGPLKPDQPYRILED